MTAIDRQRLRSLLDRERAAFAAAHPRSAAAYAAAAPHLLGGVPMTWMNMAAGGFPLYLDRARGARVTDIDGHEYVLEQPLKADFAIVRAWKADTWGNLVFRKTARNFSPLMCMAAKVTIVEAEHIVQVGELEPDSIHVPSVYVQRVVQSAGLNKWIERRTVRKQA